MNLAISRNEDSWHNYKHLLLYSMFYCYTFRQSCCHAPVTYVNLYSNITLKGNGPLSDILLTFWVTQTVVTLREHTSKGHSLFAAAYCHLSIQSIQYLCTQQPTVGSLPLRFHVPHPVSYCHYIRDTCVSIAPSTVIQISNWPHISCFLLIHSNLYFVTTSSTSAAVLVSFGLICQTQVKLAIKWRTCTYIHTYITYIHNIHTLHTYTYIHTYTDIHNIHTYTHA
jgi:hypothetical protein